ncbi:MAG: 2-oxoglutarate and iron-dependent oxygenase domain-containing protein [Pseudomonadota bacterium]
MTQAQVPVIDFAAMTRRDPETLKMLGEAAREIGFLTLANTPLDAARVTRALEAYRDFFRLPEAKKQKIDMAKTGANRGWGAPHSEQVDPNANPDYKQVFDCGFELTADDPMRARELAVYADNLWPEGMEAFRQEVESYLREAMGVAQDMLTGIALATGQDATYFTDKFTRPMALLRGNYYPPRPASANEKDFGIAAHTDYGCLTLLATDGVPGLEVELLDGSWLAVQADPGHFIINFGEMLEMWTEGAVRATVHRVVGGSEERVSIPLFFNPNYEANVAPSGSDEEIQAGTHLTKRFEETYVHLQKKS